MTSRLPWWRERYEKTPQTDHHARLIICLAALRRAVDETELLTARWWAATAAMHVDAILDQQNTVAGQRTRRRP